MKHTVVIGITINNNILPQVILYSKNEPAIFCVEATAQYNTLKDSHKEQLNEIKKEFQ